MRFWKSSRQNAWLWGVLAGITFLCAEVWQGEFTVIWRKAAMICLECIGIG